jgi:hypothetical protein
MSGYATLASFRPTSPVSTFFPINKAFSSVFTITRSNVRVGVTLGDAFPFSPDVARFNVFALHLAVFRRFRCNPGQSTCPRQVKRRLPFFARRRPFPCFCRRLAIFTRGNVRVRVRLRDACLFSPDVARFHVFAHHLAVFRLVLCNTMQRTCQASC